MSQLADTSASESLTAIHWLAVLLVVATGAIHVYAGLVEGRIPVLLAGVGFFGGIGLFALDFRRPQLYLTGVVYTAVQFPLWYVAKAGEFTAIGYVDKAIQAVLVVTLLYLYWRQRTATGRGRGTPNV
jgi:hypothetical protein